MLMEKIGITGHKVIKKRCVASDVFIFHHVIIISIGVIIDSGFTRSGHPDILILQPAYT